MADRVNFLIGYGERLASEIAAPVAGAPKRHPYTLFEARERLAPMVIETAHELDELPDVVCPADHAVALVTLHPSYLAKSYYPGNLVLFRQFHPSVGAADPVDLCLHRIGRDPVGLGPVHAGGHSAAVGIEVN